MVCNQSDMRVVRLGKRAATRFARGCSWRRGRQSPSSAFVAWIALRTAILCWYSRNRSPWVMMNLPLSFFFPTWSKWKQEQREPGHRGRSSRGEKEHRLDQPKLFESCPAGWTRARCKIQGRYLSRFPRRGLEGHCALASSRQWACQLQMSSSAYSKRGGQSTSSEPPNSPGRLSSIWNLRIDARWRLQTWPLWDLSLRGFMLKSRCCFLKSHHLSGGGVNLKDLPGLMNLMILNSVFGRSYIRKWRPWT